VRPLSDFVSLFRMGQPHTMPTKEEAPAGRAERMKVAEKHFVLGNPMQGVPDGYEWAVFGNGCFWGGERMFWRVPGVYSTAVGYIGGFTPNPTYKEVCSGRTGHNEAIRVVWDPSKVSFADLLKPFWESHNPTQGMGQGNDRGTQYRSGIYPANAEQKAIAIASRDAFQGPTNAAGEEGKITTEITDPVAPEDFYYAEDYHQQYLDKPGNRQYCGADPTGAELPPPSTWQLPEGVQAPVVSAAVWEDTYAGCALR